MKRLLALIVLFALVGPASAHFIWFVPMKGSAVQVVFSDSLEPDASVPIAKAAGIKIFARTGAGVIEGKKTEAKDQFLFTYDTKAPLEVGGVCQYGVLTKKGDPFLLMYYAKATLGTADAKTPLGRGWAKLPLEIVPAEKAAGKYQVLWQGKSATDVEVVIVVPGEDDSRKAKLDKDGLFSLGSLPAGQRLIGVRARFIEKKAGEHDGKKYTEVKHYTTWAFEMPQAKSTIAPKYPPLPEAFSSFGAAACDGYVYVYGGHVAKTHTYSTAAVTGKFRRLSLTDPKAWQELPGGVGIQGLALVSHAGKLYRIGGMQPRNKPGDPADNISIATCAVFDPKLGKWAALPELPAGRSSHDAVVVGDRIVVVGGWLMQGQGKKSVWHDTALVMDLSKQPLKWESISQPFQRRALNAAALANKVYVVGGMGPDGTEKGMDILDLASQKWSQGPILPGPGRNGFTPAVCANAGMLFVSPADGKLYRLNAKQNAWDEIGKLDQQRLVHRMVPAGAHSLLVLGGASKTGNIAQVEAINTGPRIKP